MIIQVADDFIERVKRLMRRRGLRIQDMPKTLQNVFTRLRKHGTASVYKRTLENLSRKLQVDFDELVPLDYEEEDIKNSYIDCLEEGTRKVEFVSDFIGKNWL